MTYIYIHYAIIGCLARQGVGGSGMYYWMNLAMLYQTREVEL